MKLSYAVFSLFAVAGIKADVASDAMEAVLATGKLEQVVAYVNTTPQSTMTITQRYVQNPKQKLVRTIQPQSFIVVDQQKTGVGPLQASVYIELTGKDAKPYSKHFSIDNIFKTNAMFIGKINIIKGLVFDTKNFIVEKQNV